jgi:hypothetical protein
MVLLKFEKVIADCEVTSSWPVDIDGAWQPTEIARRMMVCSIGNGKRIMDASREMACQRTCRSVCQVH